MKCEYKNNIALNPCYTYDFDIDQLKKFVKAAIDTF